MDRARTRDKTNVAAGRIRMTAQCRATAFPKQREAAVLLWTTVAEQLDICWRRLLIACQQSQRETQHKRFVHASKICFHLRKGRQLLIRAHEYATSQSLAFIQQLQYERDRR
jgi:hypothetical protein